MGRLIDYYFSFQSPWAYIGQQAFHDVARAHGAKVIYRPFALLNLFSETGGLPLAKRHPLRQRYRAIEMQRWRDKRGLNFHLKPQHWPFNPRLSDGVAIAILQSGQSPEAFTDNVFRGIWEQQLDLADPATVAELADRAGFPGAMLVEQSGSADVEAAYEHNRQDAIAHGVFGSPAYVLDGEVFWGQDRIDLLDDALTSGRAPFRADI
ncbi:MAG: 2-hydroxychromene-2-carboxylate isomerase [Xanthobacteraceae bacterium]|nr:2-hydroxychromene-2-carboxylate isomerase [Xanthobacteraceae bacterium]